MQPNRLILAMHRVTKRASCKSLSSPDLLSFEKIYNDFAMLVSDECQTARYHSYFGLGFDRVLGILETSLQKIPEIPAIPFPFPQNPQKS